MPTLNPATLPLDGVRLIEASAGTGKTYTIAGLYLRLLLERDLAVPNILVVTFTNAATEELRERIRGRIKEALDQQIAAADDTESNAATVQRLRDAMQRMDESAIFTIHGFCQRMLRDHAFESGALFDAELDGDQNELLRQVVEDYWRRRFYPATPIELDWALGQWDGPAALQKALKPLLGGGRTVIIPSLDAAQREQMLGRDRTALEALVETWGQDRDEVCALLLDYKGLGRAKDTHHPDKLAAAIDALDEFVAGNDWALPTGFALFTREKLADSMLPSAIKKGIAMPEHRFFERASEFSAARHQRLLGTQVAVLEEARAYCESELSTRKQRRNLLSFDDLLVQLEAALQAHGGEALAARIRRQYPIALMDEFQDTDPVQYAIFHRVYGQAGDPASETGLFMIGDPKQAIYSFRGADLFTYIHARRHTDPARDRFTLDTNYRSGSALVAAVNQLFSQCPTPFLYPDDIPFEPVAAAGKADEAPLLIDGQRPPALQWWFLERSEQSSNNGNPKNPINKGWARPVVAGACAAEVAELLNGAAAGRVTLGDRPLQGGDIALLVRAHSEARLLRDALAAVGVNTVYYSRDSVYASDEAEQLARVLAAIAEPGSETRVRNALATELIGATATDLDRLVPAAQAYDAQLQALRELHQLWAERGFTACFQALLERFDVGRRLLAAGGGERALTNLLQLSELLQLETRRHPGMDELVRWLQLQREQPDGNADDQQLRLESDAGLVKIVTIHKSKGLEYPLVFVPFPWIGHKPPSAGSIVFHADGDSDGNGRGRTLDLGSAEIDEHRAQAGREDLAESLRLLYVAVTRARHWCRLSWGQVTDAERSALAWLLHPDTDPERPNSKMKDLSDEQLRQTLEDLDSGDRSLSRVEDLPDTSAAPSLVPVGSGTTQLSARGFSGSIDAGWRTTSFSGLLSERRREGPDHDADDRPASDAASATEPAAEPVASPEPTPDQAPEPAAEPAPEQAPEPVLAEFDGIFQFPRGAGPGTFLHGVFERLSFPSASGDELAQVVADQLRGSGLGSEWQRVVCDTVGRVLETVLNPDDGLRLRDLHPAQCRVEMAFSYPIERLDSPSLQAILARLAAAVGGQEGGDGGGHTDLDFAPVRGLMKGFIDLVFEFQGRYYLLDYKSNHLGDRVEDYDQPALAAAMAHHHYDLQYLIYTVALHRFLAQRLPDYDYDRHLGGAYYLFLRGMRPQHGKRYGVYYARPERELIESLDRLLVGA